MNISPEQKPSVPVYPSIKMVLVAAAASTVALVSCDRQTPKPDEQEQVLEQLGGVVPFATDSEVPSGFEKPESPPGIEPQLLLGEIAIPEHLPEQPTIKHGSQP